MADTIKEFLVSLGYSVDDQSQRKFTNAIGSVDAKVAGLATAAAAAGTAVVAAVEKFASNADRIYWLGQRAHASAAGIENMAFAASQLGSSAEAAYGSIEAFGRFLQSAPGAKKLVEKWTGPFENAEDALVKFGRAMKDKPAYFRNAMASMMGLDYNFAQSLFSGEFEKQIDERKKRAASLNFDENQFTRDATAFQQSWRRLWSEVELIGKEAAGGAFGPLQTAFDQIVVYLDQHAGDIAKAVADASKVINDDIRSDLTTIRDFADAVSAAIAGRTSEAFEHLKRAWLDAFDYDPAKNKLLQALNAISDYLHKPWADAWADARRVAENVLAWVSSNVPGFLKELLGIKEAHAELAPAYGDSTGQERDRGAAGASGSWGDADAGEVAPPPARRSDTDVPVRERQGGADAGWDDANKEAPLAPTPPVVPVPSLAPVQPSAPVPEVTRQAHRAPPAEPEIPASYSPQSRRATAAEPSSPAQDGPQPARRGAPEAPVAHKERANVALSFFVKKGWTPEQSAGIVANLEAESGLNPRAEGDSGKAKGLAQWHPDRQANFERQYGRKFAEATFEQQLDFADWELRHTEAVAGKKLAATRKAREAAAVMTNEYERPLERRLNTNRRGDLAEKLIVMLPGLAAVTQQQQEQRQPVTLSQTNNITINGAVDPQATSRAVSAEMRRAGVWFRDIAGKVQ